MRLGLADVTAAFLDQADGQSYESSKPCASISFAVQALQVLEAPPNTNDPYLGLGDLPPSVQHGEHVSTTRRLFQMPSPLGIRILPLEPSRCVPTVEGNNLIGTPVECAHVIPFD